MQELSNLLRRLTEQNEAKSQVGQDVRLRAQKSVEDSKARTDEIKANMERMRMAAPDWSKMREESAQRTDKTRAEDLKFRQSLLEEFRRHNQLLDKISTLKDSDLDEKAAGQSYSIHFMLQGVIHHDLYHLGQID